MTTSVDALGLARPARGRRGAGAALGLSLLAVAVVAGLGAWANAGAVDGWYELADKPAGTPPGWVFGPVWTTLYLAMAVAAWLIWRAGHGRATRIALGLYGTQLILNAAWSPVFFAAEALAGGVVVILLLDVALTATIVAFARLHRGAALLLAPYLAWVFYATYLTIGITALN